MTKQIKYFFIYFVALIAILLSFHIVARANENPSTATMVTIPTFSSSVVNNSQSKLEIQPLINQIDELKKNSQVDLGILIVDTTNPETIEQFSIKVAEKWQVGEKGKDNGILVVLAVKDKKARIEVGYGMEGVITDALSTRILNEYAIPEFKNNNYEGGLAQIIARIKNIKDGKKVTDPVQINNTSTSKPSETKSNMSSEAAIMLLIAGIFVALFATKAGWGILFGLAIGSALYFFAQKLPHFIRSTVSGILAILIASTWINGFWLIPVFIAAYVSSMVNIFLIFGFIIELIANSRIGGSSSSSSGSSNSGGGGGRFGGGGGSGSW